MMKIRFSTNGVLRDHLGAEEFILEFQETATLRDVVNRVAGELEEHHRKILVDSDGIIQRGMMIVINDEMVQGDTAVPLENGDNVSILMPMAGG
jgi:molybdopterin converting factor small subunit